MKHAITGPRGRIFNVLDESNDRTTPITNAQATLVEAKGYPAGYWIIDGKFKTSEEVRAIRQAERKAERIAAMTPEQLAEHQVKLQRQGAYDAAAAVFESLPKGVRALWEPTRVAVAAAILRGDMAEAVEILMTTPVIYEGAEADRQLFLDLFAQ